MLTSTANNTNENAASVELSLEASTIALDNEMFVDDNTLSVNIRRIRAKLEKIGIYNYIHTKHGQGYSV